MGNVRSAQRMKMKRCVMCNVWKRKEAKKKMSRESCYHQLKEDAHLLSCIENSGLLEDLAHNGHS